MTICNRQWLLASRPGNRLRLTNFRYREQPSVEPPLGRGQVLVRNLVFSCAPTIRNWMNDAARSYRAPIGLGEPIAGPACAHVVRSAHARFPVGARIVAVSRWEDYSVLEPDTAFAPVLDVPDEIASIDALGVFGLNSLTAYVGLLHIGKPRAGETVVVSAAAGAVGSIVVQIAKLHGCRVIAIAGGASKCAWLRDTCRADGTIDYKSEDVSSALRAWAPQGVKLFFDNVGGEVLQVVTDQMAVHGRIVVCGQISAYDSDAPAPGPRDMMRLVYQRLSLHGFVLGDFLDEVAVARAQLMRWHAQGKLAVRQDVRAGFAALPAAFIDVFSGASSGAVLVSNENVA